MDAFRALVAKDITLYFSNRRALMITLAAPILIAAFFGAVLGGAPKKPSRVPVAVVDLDGSALSRQVVDAMRGDDAFDLQEMPEPEALKRVREGKARAAAVLPAGFGEAASRALFRPKAAKPEIAIHYDPSQGYALAMVKGLLAQHVMQAVARSTFSGKDGARFIADARRDLAQSPGLPDDARRDLLALMDSVERVQSRSATQGADAPVPSFGLPFEARDVEVTSGIDKRYNAYAHAFAGMGVQFVLFMGIELGVGLLLMRRMGLWKRLRAAPVSRGLLLGSRIVSGTAIAATLMAAIYAAAIAAFGVRVEGSWVGFVAVTIAFALLASTFGLLIAALGNTPEATRGLAILATLLLVMLGGAWVPTFVFPRWLQQATLFVPTRWAIDGLEAMTWRGLGPEAVMWPTLGLLAVSAAFATVAIRRFAWEE